MVNIEINGKTIQAKYGAMVIEAADAAGIYIPRFCYHKKLSVAANCRMCLIEVEKARKPLPACATPVTEGMKVYTRSKNAVTAQKGVMEFLLVNHPLDCPICDQGGECELQDIAMGYGRNISRYSEKKRVVPDKDLGSLIATEMTRCIHCTRCVRFGEEIAGVKELGAIGRGEHMEIGTYVAQTVDSELSGNMIDLCPVGALTSKPFRFSARAWEMTQRQSIAPHDNVGSNVSLHIRNNRIMRVVPAENEAINETWISDRDRFSYEGLYTDRLQQPMIKREGTWQTTDWETALQAAADSLTQVCQTAGAEQLGFLSSPHATLEEQYLLQKLARGLDCHNIDHRYRQSDTEYQTSMPMYPELGQSLQSLETLDAALFIGASIRKDQPLIGHRIRKAALKGAKISFINAIDYDFKFPVFQTLITAPLAMVENLAGVLKALVQKQRTSLAPEVSQLIKTAPCTETHMAIAQALQEADKACVVLGMQANFHPAYSLLISLAQLIAEHSNSPMGFLTPGPNSAGAWLAGMVPHRLPGGATSTVTGLATKEMLTQGLRAYFLCGVEPEYDSCVGAQAIQTLRQAEAVICMTPYVTDAMREYADVLLPMGGFGETAGTFINVEGSWQQFTGAVPPLGEARPAWKILRVLGNLCQLEGFDYLAVDEVHDEIKAQIDTAQHEPANPSPTSLLPNKLPSTNGALSRISDVPIYAVDAIVRRAEALQQTLDAQMAQISLNAKTAEQLGIQNNVDAIIKQAGSQSRLPVKFDKRIPDGCVYVPAGIAASMNLTDPFAAVELAEA